MKPPPRTSLHQRSEPDDPSYALGIKSDDDDDNDEWDDAGGGGDDDEEDEVLSLPISVASTVESSHSKINNINARALAEQRQEEQRVFSIKLVVIIAFVIVSLGVSLAIYGLVNREENTIFETEVRRLGGLAGGRGLLCYSAHLVVHVRHACDCITQVWKSS
jgi:hypothetical protein